MLGREKTEDDVETSTKHIQLLKKHAKSLFLTLVIPFFLNFKTVIVKKIIWKRRFVLLNYLIQ